MFNYLPIEQIARFIERAHRYFADKQFSESAIAIENLVARELRKLKDEVEEVEDGCDDEE
jgi:DNA helicase HerA-like ATPase